MYNKMPFTKKAHSAVHVETRKMSGECCGTKSKCCGMGLCHLIGGLLLIANLVVMVIFFMHYNNMEAMKVGGRANMKMVQQIYKTEALQQGQAQQIQAAVQQYQGAAQAPTTAQPTVQMDPTTPTQ